MLEMHAVKGCQGKFEAFGPAGQVAVMVCKTCGAKQYKLVAEAGQK